MARRPPPNGVPRGYLGNALHAHCTGRFGLVVVHNGGRPQDSIGLRWPGASSAHLVRRQRHERAPFASHNTARVRAHRGRAPRLPQVRPDGPAPGGIIEVQPWSGRCGPPLKLLKHLRVGKTVEAVGSVAGVAPRVGIPFSEVGPGFVGCSCDANPG